MIHPCTSVDEPGWLDLRLTLWPDATRQEHVEEMREFLKEPDRYGQFVCLDDDGNSVGFIEVSLRHDYVNGTESSPVGFIEGLYVRPESRRLGKGKELMAAAESWARKKGCTELASDALLDNMVSHRAHLALGFEETDRVVYFKKNLSKA